MGSYDGNFYAFNAQSGAVRWRHPVGGRISGSATIVGNAVYFSNLGSKTTMGLDLHTGRQVFSFPDGAFNPVICDSSAIYLVGYSKVYQLLVKRGTVTAARKRPARRSHPAARRHKRGAHRAVHRRARAHRHPKSHRHAKPKRKRR
jgi:outer membrane protein assembly factor BamB